MLNEHLLPVGDDPSRERGAVVAAPPHEHHPAPPHKQKSESICPTRQQVGGMNKRTARKQSVRAGSTPASGFQATLDSSLLGELFIVPDGLDLVKK